jgi:hypothetical protein
MTARMVDRIFQPIKKGEGYMVPKSGGFDRRTMFAAVTAFMFGAALLFSSSAWAQNTTPGPENILFTQQDDVQAFDFQTGLGYQTGTAKGKISGTTSVDFTFIPTGPPVGDLLPFEFHNKVIITDLDGDQIWFQNDGSGKFHLGVPGADFRGSGGPLTGTYVVTGGTGKYLRWKAGTRFTYRAIASNPPPNGRLGTVYVEVYSNAH